jgi:hypothetical protein
MLVHYIVLPQVSGQRTRISLNPSPRPFFSHLEHTTRHDLRYDTYLPRDSLIAAGVSIAGSGDGGEES